ncbi:MAG: hypothetical protein IOB09_00650 [Burkholderia sp.]|nr:hypothetical protein [Burkholderia sp.]
MNYADLMGMRARFVEFRRMSDLNAFDEGFIGMVLDAVDDALDAIRDDTADVPNPFGVTPLKRVLAMLLGAALAVDDAQLQVLANAERKRFVDEGG